MQRYMKRNADSLAKKYVRIVDAASQIEINKLIAVIIL